MILPWIALVACIAGAAGLGVVVGVLVARPRVAPEDLEEDWGDAEDGEPEEWVPRISPERYLIRFPEGDHVEQARRIAGR